MDKNFLLALTIIFGLIDCAIIANKKGYVLSSPFSNEKTKEMNWIDNSPDWKPKNNKEESLKEDAPKEETPKLEEKPKTPEKKPERRFLPLRNPSDC